MKAIIAAVLLCLGCTSTFALDWLCSTAQPTRLRINLVDLVQAYSGQPVLRNRQWLLVVMLPADHPDTRAAFAQLGVSPQAAERMANDSSLVDRGIRLVQTQDQLIQKVGLNPPAAGFTSFFIGDRDVTNCF